MNNGSNQAPEPAANSASAADIDTLRSLLVSSAKESAFRKVVQATMIRDRQHGPVVELNRMSGGFKRGQQQTTDHQAAAAAAASVAASASKRNKKKGSGAAGRTVFEQMVGKLTTLTPESLLLPHRVWKVKFVGEWHNHTST